MKASGKRAQKKSGQGSSENDKGGSVEAWFLKWLSAIFSFIAAVTSGLGIWITVTAQQRENSMGISEAMSRLEESVQLAGDGQSLLYELDFRMSQIPVPGPGSCVDASIGDGLNTLRSHFKQRREACKEAQENNGSVLLMFNKVGEPSQAYIALKAVNAARMYATGCKVAVLEFQAELKLVESAAARQCRGVMSSEGRNE